MRVALRFVPVLALAAAGRVRGGPVKLDGLRAD